MTLNDLIYHADMEFNSGQDATRTVLEILKRMAGWRECKSCQQWHDDPDIIRCRCGREMQ